MPGTPSGKSIVRDFGVGGGGYGGGMSNPYGYAMWEEEQGRAAGEYAMQKETHELAKEREAREQAKQDRYEKRQDTVERGLAKIDEALSNPASMKFQDAYIKVMGDPDVRAASAFSAGRQAVKELMGQRHEEHQNYVQGWNDTLSHYMYDGGIHSIGDDYLSKDGTPDWNKLEPLLTQHLKNRQTEQAQAQQERLMQLQSMAKAAHLRPTGIDEKTMMYKYGQQKDDDFLANKQENEDTSAQQPSEGQMVRQNGKTYVYRGGSYVPAD